MRLPERTGIRDIQPDREVIFEMTHLYPPWFFFEHCWYRTSCERTSSLSYELLPTAGRI
jgi:hypothetical protein